MLINPNGAKSFFIKAGGAYKKPKNMFIKVNGVWKPVKNLFMRYKDTSGGILKEGWTTIPLSSVVPLVKGIIYSTNDSGNRWTTMGCIDETNKNTPFPNNSYYPATIHLQYDSSINNMCSSKGLILKLHNTSAHYEVVMLDKDFKEVWRYNTKKNEDFKILNSNKGFVALIYNASQVIIDSKTGTILATGNDNSNLYRAITYSLDDKVGITRMTLDNDSKKFTITRIDNKYSQVDSFTFTSDEYIADPVFLREDSTYVYIFCTTYTPSAGKTVLKYNKATKTIDLKKSNNYTTFGKLNNIGKGFISTYSYTSTDNDKDRTIATFDRNLQQISKVVMSFAIYSPFLYDAQPKNKSVINFTLRNNGQYKIYQTDINLSSINPIYDINAIGSESNFAIYNPVGAFNESISYFE